MRPRLGFLGLGWIGRARMEAIHRAGVADIVAMADVAPAMARAAAETVGAVVVPPEELLHPALGLDGLVIATPSALHADQAIAALRGGMAVFCQKPLARSAAETASVIAAAQAADRLLGVDLSYRHLSAVRAAREVLQSGHIGEVFATDLVFHNAYGPDKAWFTNPALSGGGCVIDLGIHLVDLALWLLDAPKIEAVESRLFAAGRPLLERSRVEDYAVARLHTAGGATISLACSWFLHAGQDAVISLTVYGTEGAVAVSNVGGSFYDFRAEHHQGTHSTVLAEPPDDWGGRAAVAWAQQLAEDRRYRPSVEDNLAVARTLDRIYGEVPCGS
ncbi:MAG: oxidoreductase [Acidimicrobiia bacterium]|nr:oxidoreductase [Acidimicrobiia bacterium]